MKPSASSGACEASPAGTADGGADASPEPPFAEVIAALRARAEDGEGNHRRAEACLRAAEGMERQADQYRAVVEGIKRSVPVGQRSGVRLSHKAHAVKRAIQGRDRYIREAEAALAFPTATVSAIGNGRSVL